MIGPEPGFAKSEYFVPEPGNWHLKPGAPEKVRREFEAFMAQDEPEAPDYRKMKITDDDLDSL